MQAVLVDLSHPAEFVQSWMTHRGGPYLPSLDPCFRVVLPYNAVARMLSRRLGLKQVRVSNSAHAHCAEKKHRRAVARWLVRRIYALLDMAHSRGQVLRYTVSTAAEERRAVSS